MTADADAALSPATAEIDAKIQYLLPGSLINRRFWAPGEEYNTGEYAPYDVKIKNARLAGPFTLDEHGFAIERHKTDISDWLANYGPDGEWPTHSAVRNITRGNRSPVTRIIQRGIIDDQSFTGAFRDQCVDCIHDRQSLNPSRARLLSATIGSPVTGCG